MVSYEACALVGSAHISLGQAWAQRQISLTVRVRGLLCLPVDRRKAGRFPSGFGLRVPSNNGPAPQRNARHICPSVFKVVFWLAFSNRVRVGRLIPRRLAIAA